MKRAGINVEIHDDDEKQIVLSWEDVDAIFRAMVLAAPVVDNTEARERLARHMDENHGVLLLASEISDIESIIMPCAVDA